MIVRSLLAGLSVAGLLVAAAPAFAGDTGTAPVPAMAKLDLRKGETVAMLAKPLKSYKEAVVDGRIWHCEGDTCRVGALSTAHALPLVRECSDGAKSFGAFTSYQTGDDLLAGDMLAKCNTSAR